MKRRSGRSARRVHRDPVRGRLDRARRRRARDRRRRPRRGARATSCCARSASASGSGSRRASAAAAARGLTRGAPRSRIGCDEHRHRAAAGDDRRLQRRLERARPRRDRGAARARRWCSRTTRPASAPRATRRSSTSRGIFESWPDIAFSTRRLYVREDLVVQEWTATATHVKELRRGRHRRRALGPPHRVGRDGRDPVRGRPDQAQGRLLGLGLDPGRQTVRGATLRC